MNPLAADMCVDELCRHFAKSRVEKLSISILTEINVANNENDALYRLNDSNSKMWSSPC